MYEIPDAAWELVAESLRTAPTKCPTDDRLRLDGVLWMLCSGAAWRDMLERFGPWSVLYQQFRGWRNQGTFDLRLKRRHYCQVP
ncbi:transposase [Pseudomonas chlororaphis]|nr:transposase [Pseudomonas chlororaphis]